MGELDCPSGHEYNKTPDVVMLSLPGPQHSNSQQLRVVGEVKVLAQPISYMRDLHCMYGFITSYDQTIFLRQIRAEGSWRIEHSPVIKSCGRYAPGGHAAQSTGPDSLS
ncbi:hypothetical protein N7461_003434 [Penicillium sp. DV-2018c]|nr:hypothetical protein N7461_003434 [Penicillium sp. DV-2018c]